MEVKQDRYVISSLDELYYHLRQYKDRKDPWEAAFYNVDRDLLFTVESDEETMEALQDINATYELATQLLDMAMMMGNYFDL